MISWLLIVELAGFTCLGQAADHLGRVTIPAQVKVAIFYFALVAAGVLMLCACATPQPHAYWPTPVITHLQDTDDKAEHDETRGFAGTVVESYPNVRTPQRVITRYPNGGMLEFRLVVPGQWAIKATGFRKYHMPVGWLIPELPDGSYTLTWTNYPGISVLKTAEGQYTVAYFSVAAGGQAQRIVPTIQQALAVVGK
jgi:hypothetical protein